MATKRPRTGTRSPSDPATLAAWDTLLWIANIHHEHTNEFHSFTPRVWQPYRTRSGGWWAVATREDDAQQIPEMIERGLWKPETFKTRASYIMVSLNQHLIEASARNRRALQDPNPSSPVRPPRIALYLRRKSSDPHTRTYAWTFAEFYAARRAVECIIQDHQTKWVDDNHLLVTFGEVTATLSTDAAPAGLSELMEYEFSDTERAWEPSSDFLTAIEKVFRNYQPRDTTTQDTPTPTEPRSQTRREQLAERKAEKPKREPKPSDLIDLATLLADTDIEPKEARNALRKSNTPKPPHGWSWSKKDAPEALKHIQAEVKKLRKK